MAAIASNPKSSFLASPLHAYLVAHGSAPDAIQQALIEETRKLGDRAVMQIPPEQGSFMTALVRIAGVKSAIEIGTFTGYSALCIARGLEPDGRLICCDISEEWTAIARRYWEAAGVAGKIELRMGPALETIRSLPLREQFDLAFLDAEKTEYIDYYEELLPRMRSTGLILADNVLASGRVADGSNSEPFTLAIRRFNDHVLADPRVESVMLPLGDGLTLIRKR